MNLLVLQPQIILLYQSLTMDVYGGLLEYWTGENKMLSQIEYRLTWD
jgi:hypothetical protein